MTGLFRTHLILLISLSFAAVGCFDDSGQPASGRYKSFNPHSFAQWDQEFETNNGNNVNNYFETGGSTNSDMAPAGVLTKADVAVDNGDTLYALSPYKGLFLVDLSTPEELPVLGSYPLTGTPIQMHVADGYVYILLKGVWQLGPRTEGAQDTWNEASRLVVLDVQDPSNISEAAAVTVPGAARMSRLVGDMFYVISEQFDFCWGCENYGITMSSLSVGDLANIAVVDQVVVAGSNTQDEMPVYMSDEHIYVSRYYLEDDRSTVEMIDISDPGGVMVHGGITPVHGQISGGWQMNEADGVFMTVSKASGYSSEEPVVETFTIEPSNTLTPLGALTVSATSTSWDLNGRFDGTRLFLNTPETLHIIELSDPHVPVQGGELALLWKPYYYKPVGDSLVVIGDKEPNGNAMYTSLFNIADIANPVEVATEQFGGATSRFSQKYGTGGLVFETLPNSGFVAVPYESWDGYIYKSPVQFFSFTQDSLVKRGALLSNGYAGHLFVHNDSLVRAGNERVESFSYADLDTPGETADTRLTNTVYSIAPIGTDYMARIRRSWSSAETHLDIISRDDLDAVTPIASLSLPWLNNGYERYYGERFHYEEAKLFVKGEHLFVVRGESREYWNGKTFVYGDHIPTQVVVVNISDPENPSLVSAATFPYEFPRPAPLRGSVPGTAREGENMVMIGDTIVMKYFDNQNSSSITSGIWGLNIRYPENPVISFDLPDNDERKFCGLHAHNQMLITSHYDPRENDATDPKYDLVSFYLDRVDLSNPGAPLILPSVNIPGNLISYNPDTGTIITVDYTLHVDSSDDYVSCYNSPHYRPGYFGDNGCYWVDRTLNFLSLSNDVARLKETRTYDDGFIIAAIATESRLFVQLETAYYCQYLYHAGEEPCDSKPNLEIIELDELGTFPSMGRHSLPEFTSQISYAHGTRVAVISEAPNSIRVYDSSEPYDATITLDALLTDYSFDLYMDTSALYSANSMWGMQLLPLTGANTAR